MSYGSREQKKYVTTYFRKVFTINNPGSYSGFTLDIKRDDGAVVYVNGIEVFRSNLVCLDKMVVTSCSQFFKSFRMSIFMFRFPVM